MDQKNPVAPRSKKDFADTDLVFKITTSRLDFNITNVDLLVGLTILIECGDGSKKFFFNYSKMLSVSLTKCLGFCATLYFLKLSRSTLNC